MSVVQNLIKCPSCQSRKIRLVGEIPTTDKFAGCTLTEPLKGSYLYDCYDCHLWFRYPRLSKTELDALYLQRTENIWQYSEQERLDWKIAAGWIREQMTSGSSVLDVGCFDGSFLDYLGSDYQRFGIEIHPEASNRARKKGINIIGTDITELNTLSTQFDVVIALDMIEHVEDPLNFLWNITHCTRSSGIIIVSTGNTEAWSWQLMGSSYWYCTLGEHISFISPRWLKQAMKQVRLELGQLTLFAHTQRGFIFKIRELSKNVFYKWFPNTMAYLRAKGFGGKDVRCPELANTPPYWFSAKDHIICLLKRQDNCA